MSINYESNYLLLASPISSVLTRKIVFLRWSVTLSRPTGRWTSFIPCSWKLERPKPVNKCWNALPVISGLYVIMGSWHVTLISHSPNGMIWSLKRRKEILFCIQRPRSMFMNQLFFVCVINCRIKRSVSSRRSRDWRNA